MINMYLKKAVVFTAVIMLAAAGGGFEEVNAQGRPPFGGKAEISFGNDLWAALAKAGLAGADAIISGLYKGALPHGEVLETIQSTVSVRGRFGTVIVKRNYGPRPTLKQVNGNRGKYLKWITVMFKREAGFDPGNKDWFWAKYSPAGGYDKHPKTKLELVGKIGSRKFGAGCIGCHAGAPGGDMVFFNSAM